MSHKRNEAEFMFDSLFTPCRCRWEGNLCYPDNMTKQVTDYGVCYTFNGGPHPLPTEKTGSRFGLALTLNIEQYEYMRGPQSDAGVKV